jgi:hypothetical protein
MNIGIGMVRRRVIAVEDADDARILAERKARREEKIAEGAENPQPLPSFLSRFNGRRTLAIP